MIFDLKRMVLLLLCLCAACSGSAEVAPTPTEKPDLLATMAQPTIPPLATYESRTYGYSFVYPATSQLEEADQGGSVWIDQQVQVAVSDVNPEAATGDTAVIESSGDTLVNAFPARRLSGYVGAVGGSTPQRYERIVIPRNNRYYSITVYELRNDVVLPADRTLGDVPLNAMSLFDVVVGTFIFIS